MQELILAIAGLILELLVFFCAGSLLTRILKMKAEVTMIFTDFVETEKLYKVRKFKDF